jgi:uracil phosphoribosyltransferase
MTRPARPTDGRVVPLDDDPVVGAALAALRDATTPPDAFRAHARRLGAMLTSRAVADLPGRAGSVRTPLGDAPAVTPGVAVVAVPVLRAGLGLLPGVHDVLPDAPVGMIGLERDATTLAARCYYLKVPPLAGARVLVLEPMLATGGSAADAVMALLAEGADEVHVLSVVATATAIDRVLATHPSTRVITAAIDPGLDARGYIVPGLGDFGDRLFATPH